MQKIIFILILLISFSCNKQDQNPEKNHIKVEQKKKTPAELVLEFEKMFGETDKDAAEAYLKLEERFTNFSKSPNEQNLKLVVEQIDICKKVFSQTSKDFEDIPVAISLNEKTLQHLYSAVKMASDAYKLKRKAMDIAYETFAEKNTEHSENYQKTLIEGDKYNLQAWGELQDAKKEVGLK